MRTSPGLGRVIWMLAGIAALVGGTLLGWSGDLLEAIATPPVVVRAALVGLSVVAGLWCLRAAVVRIDAGRAVADGDFATPDMATPDFATGDLATRDLATRDLAPLVRGVRFVFLSVAAFAAAAGWLLGHPLPIVVALVIAGVDILETTFLLVVVSLRREP